jgi:LmbE family N-acetylglucosaminyl deacetylase
MIICLSPHLDDAILSCGAQLWQHRQAGTPVTVLNIFTATGPDLYRPRPLSFRPQALTDERIQEEQQAAGLLDLHSQALAFDDAPFRDRRYRAYHHLMGPLSRHEDSLVTAVTARVRAVAAELQPTLILAPLGVGMHVDHQITHVVGQRLAPDYPVAFYEDMPYSLAPYALLRRLPATAPTPVWDELRQASYAYYAQHPVYRSLPRWQQPLAWLGIRAWLRQQAQRPLKTTVHSDLQAEVVSCSATAFERKVAAIAAYRSQFHRMFVSLDVCRQQLADYALRLNNTSAYSERLWRTALTPLSHEVLC